MEVVKTLEYKIKNHSKIFGKTIEIFNEALSFIINVIDQEFDSIGHLSMKSLVPAVESFIHFTKTNTNPKYKNDCFTNTHRTFVEVQSLKLLVL
ncbi:hypothetical protein [Paenibacillus vietnamensis]|uniref:hypothetical protein n=1 Tax=Paenibacillus vietnamensis TaxID=2590547 RepID=UPI001CD18A16|nr:hypothetical protein [Paenibacillus vietnamensis]